jgi:hypothetical protein
MKKCLSLLLLAGFVAALGCAKEPDPRSRPDFVDTSDPSKVMETMKQPPNQPKPGGGGGGMGAGAGAPPGTGS